MTNLEAIECVNELNDFFKSKPWLDIDVYECSLYSAVLHRGIDLTAGPDVEMTFDIFFSSRL